MAWARPAVGAGSGPAPVRRESPLRPQGWPRDARDADAPGNGAPPRGLKVVTDNGWFAARPSGTENVYKLYLESFRDEAHLRQILEDAQALIAKVFARVKE